MEQRFHRGYERNTTVTTTEDRTGMGSAAERVNELRELASRDPAAAQDAAWAWFKQLGELAGSDRTAGAAALEELFATGRPSSGIDGPTEGILVAPLLQPLGVSARLV